VTIIYTPAYVAAAPVMRIYILGLVALVVELATVMLLLRQGAFSMRLGVLALRCFRCRQLVLRRVPTAWRARRRAAVTAIGSSIWQRCGRISRRTGIPLRRLQDWRSLGLLLLCAALAALFAWVAASRALAAFGPEVRVAAGGGLLAIAYLALLALCGLGRDALAASRRVRGETVVPHRLACPRGREAPCHRACEPLDRAWPRVPRRIREARV